MPHDFSIWARICREMQAAEDQMPPGHKEKVEEYRNRLRGTALALPDAYIRSVQAAVHTRCRAIFDADGGHINEGTTSQRVGRR